MQTFDLELVIFDLDGTLTQTQSGAIFPKNLDDRVPLPHTRDKVAKLHEFGVHVAVATNQGGIAYDYYEYEELREALAKQLYSWYSVQNWNIAICPHHPNGTSDMYARECVCRKPSPYMLLHLMGRHMAAPSRTLFVGDMDSDKEAAERAGCHFMWARDYFLEREWQ